MNGSVFGNIISPKNTLYQYTGLIEGKVVVNSISSSRQINVPTCPIQIITPLTTQPITSQGITSQEVTTRGLTTGADITTSPITTIAGSYPLTTSSTQIPVCTSPALNDTSFETSYCNDNICYQSAPRMLGGWKVSSGEVNIRGTWDWKPITGKQSVDLKSTGGLEQTISVVPGNGYVLTFYLAGNPATKGLKYLDVLFGSLHQVIDD